MSDGNSSQSPLLMVAVAVAVCAMLFGTVAVAITMNPGSLESLNDVKTVNLRAQSKLKHCCLFKTTARFRATTPLLHAIKT